jgi:hypothetical protein
VAPAFARFSDTMRIRVDCASSPELATDIDA